MQRPLTYSQLQGILSWKGSVTVKMSSSEAGSPASSVEVRGPRLSDSRPAAGKAVNSTGGSQYQ